MNHSHSWVPGLLLALGAVACGPSSSSRQDAYVGFVDASGFDSKFIAPSCGGNVTCYQAQTGRAAGAPVAFYNLGFVAAASLAKDAMMRPILKPSASTPTVYDFAEGCAAGKEFDPRLDAFRQDAQYPVFTALPMATTSTSAAPVVPLVKVQRWTGAGDVACNAIKSADSLKKGKFGGEAEENSTYALRAVIDGSMAVRPLTPESTYGASFGWYQGLQLGFLEGGAVALDADGAVPTMDGVLIHSQGAAPSKVTDNNALVFAAAPTAPTGSSVVRLYEFTTPMGVKRDAYTGLCYQAPCAADQVDMTNLKSTGLLFIFGGPRS